MLTAANAVIDDRASIRSTAKAHNIHYSTLCHYVLNLKAARAVNQPALRPGYKSNRKVFSDDEEMAIATYLSTASDLYYGMSPKDARSLAYQCAVKFNIRCPEPWKTNLTAGEDWLSGFLSRHPHLSIRTPESTSLARGTSFKNSTD